MKSPAVVNFSSAPHSVELREFARPEPGADDVILAVEAVGKYRAGGPVEMGEVASGIAHAVPPVLLLMVAEVLAVSMRVEPPVPVRERAEGENLNRHREVLWLSPACLDATRQPSLFGGAA